MSMVLCKIVLRSASLGGEVFFSIRVNADFSWLLLLLGHNISPNMSPFLQQFPQYVMSVDDVRFILSKLNASRICVGNEDDKFSVLVQKNEGKFMNAAGTISQTSSSCKIAS